MITWMQRHKKYLIITIWVSVIAFVGAGFVGWGALDLNLDRSSSIAKVGNHKINIKTYQRAYANTFNYYNNVRYNGELTEEIAKSIGIDQQVFNSLVEEALLLNFADELGLIALDSDVIEAITNVEEFQVDGVFSKEIYTRTLQNAYLKPAEYEDVIRKQVVLNKIYSTLLNIPVTGLEKEIFGSTMFLQDRLSVATITVDDNEVSLSDNETITYWEANKNNFLTEKIYYFDKIFMPVSKNELSEDEIKSYWEEIKYFYKNADEQIAEYESVKPQIEAALRLKNIIESEEYKTTFIGFKSGNISAQNSISVKESSIEYDTESFQMLSVGDVSTPIKRDDGYEILKLTKVALPEPKTYEDAKKQVVAVLRANKKSQLLEQKARARLSLFNGVDLGFIGTETENIPGYTKEQTSIIINNIFNSKNKKGYVIVGEKAFLYNITDQKLPDNDKLAQNDYSITQIAQQIKSTEIRRKIIEILRSRYKIELYYTFTKGNSV